jgi:hypothetical protein
VAITGGCLCGKVRFRVTGELRRIIVCHCGQCRKQTGYAVAATAATLADFKLDDETTLGWYRATPAAERGFCTTCGSVLFWKPDNGHAISIMAGSLDGPTGLEIDKHIFVADKPDWYDITDGKPQDQTWS